MESEKMKEIKKALENCTIKGKKCEDCFLVDKHPFACVKNLLCQSLTLINELESESRTFLESKTMWKRLHTEVCEENQQLKDRIAELEKENETKTDTITDLLKSKSSTKKRNYNSLPKG